MRILLSLILIVITSPVWSFQVVENTPVSNSLVALPNTVIEITFDDQIDIASIDEYSAMVFGRWSGPADCSFDVIGFGNILQISVVEEFFSGEYVMVQLSNQCSALNDDPLNGGYSFGFWIRSLPGSMNLIDIGHLAVREEGEGLIQSYGAYAGDVNNDGWSDLSVVNETSGDLRVFLSNNGVFEEFDLYDLPLGDKPSANEGVDFNLDGEIDLVIGNTQGDMVSCVFGNGDGSFSEEEIYTADQGVRGVTVLDLEGDGDMDIASANRQGSNISIFQNDGLGNFSLANTINSVLSAETAIISADMNEDGFADLIVGGYVSDEIGVFLNDGNGNFNLFSQVDTGDAPWMITMGDVNGDGHIDIAAANSGSNAMAVHFGDGEGNLSVGSDYATGGFPLAIDLGDLDGDGDLDMISSNYSGGSYTLYENTGAGEFENPQTLQSEIAGSCAIFHDRNNDGVMDITAIDELADVLIFFENPTVGILEYEELHLQASPNPFVNTFTLSTEGLKRPQTLLIIDASGKEIARKYVEPEIQNLSWTVNLDSGIYFITDANQSRRFTTLIKQ